MIFNFFPMLHNAHESGIEFQLSKLWCVRIDVFMLHVHRFQSEMFKHTRPSILKSQHCWCKKMLFVYVTRTSHRRVILSCIETDQLLNRLQGQTHPFFSFSIFNVKRQPCTPFIGLFVTSIFVHISHKWAHEHVYHYFMFYEEPCFLDLLGIFASGLC